MDIIFYSDAGHGWGVVHRKELIKYNVIDKITKYSYQKGDWVYLEEDCDLYMFIQAVEKTGQKVTLKCRRSTQRSRIRDYQRFVA